jgi:hypothetical protein
VRTSSGYDAPGGIMSSLTTDPAAPPPADAGFTWETYEDFSSGSLSDERWGIKQVPQPDGSVWQYQEPNARYRFSNGALEIRVPRFEKFHNANQNFDNAKILILSERVFAVPQNGSLIVSARVSAEKLGGRANDFRDGFVSLNVVEFETGLVLDLLATGERLGALWERMPANAPNSFLHVVDAPLHSPPTSPGQWHDFAICINSSDRSAQWRVDGKLLMEVNGVPAVPTNVRIGMGILTIQPLTAAGSNSLRGQGMVGRWTNLRIGTAP